MSDSTKCPVCKNVDGGTCAKREPFGLARAYECTSCGYFAVHSEAYSWLTDGLGESGEHYGCPKLTRVQRALVSHRLRNSKQDGEPRVITNELLEHVSSEGGLPSPGVQAENLIRFIGDEVRREGEAVATLPDHLHATIGAPSREAANGLLIELRDSHLLKANYRGSAGTRVDPKFLVAYPTELNLTLNGWQRYEDERHGRFDGNYGFIAMQFGEEILDCFVRDTVKPAVEEGLGYDLVDMRDVPKPGIIDNIIRTRIKDAAFVIVDLTHDNRGAYWEAGYAEGLGKPVIYICERSKFDEKKTHFDTNHCTTLMWTSDEPKEFRDQLVATLRRSLEGQ